MKEKDIIMMIDETAAWQQEADRQYLEDLGHRATSDLHRWKRARIVVWNIAASVMVVVIAGVYAMLLPQRTDDRQVLCNVRDDEALVVNRVCSVMGNCADRQVINIMDMK